MGISWWQYHGLLRWHCLQLKVSLTLYPVECADVRYMDKILIKNSEIPQHDSCAERLSSPAHDSSSSSQVFKCLTFAFLTSNLLRRFDWVFSLKTGDKMKQHCCRTSLWMSDRSDCDTRDCCLLQTVNTDAASTARAGCIQEALEMDPNLTHFRQILGLENVPSRHKRWKSSAPLEMKEVKASDL